MEAGRSGKRTKERRLRIRAGSEDDPEGEVDDKEWWEIPQAHGAQLGCRVLSEVPHTSPLAPYG